MVADATDVTPSTLVIEAGQRFLVADVCERLMIRYGIETMTIANWIIGSENKTCSDVIA